MILELHVNIPGQDEKIVPLSSARVLLGSLLSNQVVLNAPGVEPIHALIEQGSESEDLVIVDLFSNEGVVVNGKKIDVEHQLKENDQIGIGSVKIRVDKTTVPGDMTAPALGETQVRATTKQAEEIEQEDVNMPVDVSAFDDQMPVSRVTPRITEESDDERRKEEYEAPVIIPESMPSATAGKTVSSSASLPSSSSGRAEGSPAPAKKNDNRLFSPKKARPSGSVLEIVAFWGDTVLEVDHFHPRIKGHEKATIGEEEAAHFISAGKEKLPLHTIAVPGEGNFKLNLLDGMEARIRQDGKVAKAKGKKRIKMGKRDLAYVSYGPINYFIMNIRPPKLVLPKQGTKDPFLMMLSMFFFFAYLLVVVPIMVSGKQDLEKNKEDDPWAIINLPEEKLKQLESKIPKPKIVQKLAKVKTTPKVPPKPKKEPFKPAKPVAKQKPKQRKPTPKPAVKNLKVNPNQSKRPVGAKTPRPPRPSNSGMASTGAKKPNFKLAGPKNNQPKGAAGGAIGAGNGAQGGRRKGTSTADYRGVEGVKNKKPSGMNLSDLGFGVGKIRDITGAGAISTPFKNSAGGAGGGAGSANKTYGLGGSGNSKSVGLAGPASGVNNFGSGSGSFGGGEGGSGGLGGIGRGSGRGDGRGRANVVIPPGDPVSSGGLTSQEIMAVIRANLNQIRHCYEQMLQRSPGVSGKVKVKFVVALNGRVSSSNILSSSISDSTLQGCISGKVRRWKFPRPRGGQPVTITYPFSFSPL